MVTRWTRLARWTGATRAPRDVGLALQRLLPARLRERRARRRGGEAGARRGAAWRAAPRAATCSTCRAASAAIRSRSPGRLPRDGRRPLAGAARRGAPPRRRRAVAEVRPGRLPRAAVRRRSFDAALNLFTSLGYLGDEEDTKALAEIGRVLRPGGRLVIETMHRDRLVSARQRPTGGCSARGACCWSSAFDPPRAWLRRRRRSSSRAATSATRARGRSASTPRPSCSRCSTAPASPRPAATATSTARRSERRRGSSSSRRGPTRCRRPGLVAQGLRLARSRLRSRISR